MKIKKIFEDIMIDEGPKRSPAAIEASQKGLVYKGWSKFGPPDKEATHKVENGKLVPIEPTEDPNAPNDALGEKPEGGEAGETSPQPNAHYPEATAQAQHLGLIKRGGGDWADSSGNVVAQEKNGILVKTGGMVKEPSTKLSTMVPAQEEEPDSYTDQNSAPEPEQEPEIPQIKSHIEKLLALSGGDMQRLQTTLAKKFHSAQSPEERQKYNGLMKDARAHEDAETTAMRDKLAGLQATKNAEREARRAKYPQAQRSGEDQVDPEIAKKQAAMLAKVDQREPEETGISKINQAARRLSEPLPDDKDGIERAAQDSYEVMKHVRDLQNDPRHYEGKSPEQIADMKAKLSASWERLKQQNHDIYDKKRALGWNPNEPFKAY